MSKDKDVKDDSVGDVKVGELGFGSVAEGGSFIALPNASTSQEIRLEGGGGSLLSAGGGNGSLQIIEEKVDQPVEDKVGKVDEIIVKQVDDDGLEETKVGLAAGEDAFGDSASSVVDGGSTAGGSSTGNEDGTATAADAEESVSVSGGKIGANSITSSLLEEERLKHKELSKQYKQEHEAHLEEVERLNALISDLSRRLQNAKHTVEATKKVGKNAADTSSRFRAHIGQVSNALRLETAKNATTQRKKLHAEEAQRFELNKRKATKAHDSVRMAILDHSMTGMKNPTQKIINMKKSIKKMEVEHESQKLLLQHLTQMERMTEDLTEVRVLLSCLPSLFLFLFSLFLLL